MYASTFADIDLSFEYKVSVLKQRTTVPGNFFYLFFKTNLAKQRIEIWNILFTQKWEILYFF